MIPVIVILAYLALIAVVGSVAFRRGKTNTEDFFLADRPVGEEKVLGIRLASPEGDAAYDGDERQVSQDDDNRNHLLSESKSLPEVADSPERAWGIGNQ